MLLNRLRAIREAHGLTQPQLAARAEVGLRVITDLETEPGYQPRFSVAEKLCRYFDVSLGHLFFFDWETDGAPAARLTEEVVVLEAVG